MGVFDNELILPGSSTEITSDYSLGYDTSLFGTTDSVTIIGTAFNGPVGRAVPVYSPEHAAYIFGDSYDYTTRREATLVAEIKNAWERGCRTIYAVRVSGQEIYKDFALVPETKLKLRVAGLFPSNQNKNIYMVYDNTEGAESIKLYKPSSRATIAEKLEGLVESEEEVLVTKIELNQSYGYTKDSRLVEVIKTINEHNYNNVIKVSVVDENGNDVTVASKEAQGLSLGAIFPGAYFIGRDKNFGEASTNVQYKLVEGNNKPYETFSDLIYKQLVLNSDVTSEYPVYAAKMAELNSKFQGLVTMSTMFDFLEVYGKVDEVFGQDSKDYEEVELDDFDLYQRLGSGFAITARAEVDPSSGAIKRVKETPVSDANRVVGITDGIYSMLENLNSKYRVLVSGAADRTITGKLPRKDAYKIVVPQQVDLADLIEVESVVNPKDFTEAKKYKIVLAELNPSEVPDAKEVGKKLYTAQTVKAISAVDSKAVGEEVALPENTYVISHNGSIAIEGNAVASGSLVDAAGGSNLKLLKVMGGKLVEVESAVNKDLENALFLLGAQVYKTDLSKSCVELVKKTKVELGVNADSDAYEYLLVDDNGIVFVYHSKGTDLEEVVTVGSVAEIFNDNDDKTFVTVQSQYGVTNVVQVVSTEFDYITIEELVNILNEDANLKQHFVFKLSQQGALEKDTIVTDGFTLSSSEYEATMAADKKAGIDTGLYIPYKTPDNFARQLAQHCTYTSLKTAPTHGVIGCTTLTDVNLASIAKKVDALMELDLKLYAKKSNGKDMLDANNLPYPIGRNISIPVGQYTIVTQDGYTYTTNTAAGYAGMVSCLPLEQSSTNQPFNAKSISYELTNYQLGKLTQKGFVTYKQSYTNGIVVTDGVTMAPASSPFRRLSATRIAGAVEEVIRTATEPFIGKQNHLANRNSMQTAIKSGLESLKGTLIEAYSFKLATDTSATKMGIVNIDYRIVPIYEIREIRNQITVGDSI